MIKALAIFSVLLTLAAAAAAEVDWTLDLRARWETNDTPSGNPALAQRYDFSNLRARLGLDAGGERWSIHGVLQGAASYDLPANGAFGIGPVYLAASRGDTDPSDFGLLELAVSYRTERLQVTLGRQQWGDGVETMTGVAYADDVKKRRLGERLVGNWDWPNVGRRFDGLTFGVASERLHLAGFVLEPLAGGVNYADAFERLDDLRVSGVTLTGRYGQWLPRGEWRAFVIDYDDERRGALTAAGGPIEIRTLGASVLFASERADLVLWGAWQQGDWGRSDHDAWAYVAEAGRLLVDGEVKLAGRIGVAEASGDGTPGGDHESFFNLLPTNHKFYGAIDYSAFSNLRDLYLEAVLTRGRLSVTLGLHRFQLPEPADAWYGGSGAFNETALGYAARRPAAGRFSDSTLGNEIDVSVGWKLTKALALAAGASYFDGGGAAAEVLTIAADGTWGYVQLSWQR